MLKIMHKYICPLVWWLYRYAKKSCWQVDTRVINMQQKLKIFFQEKTVTISTLYVIYNHPWVHRTNQLNNNYTSTTKKNVLLCIPISTSYKVTSNISEWQEKTPFVIFFFNLQFMNFLQYTSNDSNDEKSVFSWWML